MRRPRITYANVTATLALVLAMGGGTYAIGQSKATNVDACIRKADAPNPGLVFIPYDGMCKANENPVSWVKEPDTPLEVRDKLTQVDGDGSGVDASFLDGINSTGFLRNTGKAVDADKLDGLNSSAFARRGTASSGVIGLSSVAGNSCKDVQLGIGNLKVGDIINVNVTQGDALPAGLVMQELDIPEDGKLNLRVCNGTNVTSPADNEIKIRWYALRP